MKTGKISEAGKLARIIKHIYHFLSHEDVQTVGKHLYGLMQNWHLQASTVDVITYDEVIEYFVKNRPSDEWVAKGALMVEPQQNEMKLTWIFLDSNNDPVSKPNGSVYGKQVTTRAIDADLREFLDDRSLIIFE